jgi:hypothetical protein
VKLDRSRALPNAWSVAPYGDPITKVQCAQYMIKGYMAGHYGWVSLNVNDLILEMRLSYMIFGLMDINRE